MIGKIRLLSALVFAAFTVSFAGACAAQVSGSPHSGGDTSAPHTFGVENGKFVLDGKPFQIIAGEMHYARIPRAYWRARLRMAKAM